MPYRDCFWYFTVMPVCARTGAHFSVEVEDVLQVDGNRAVVGVGLHDVSHEIPPFAVDGGVGALCPQFGILDLNVAEEDVGFPLQEDGVILSTVVVDHILHFGLQLIVALFVLGLHAGVQLHLKALDHCVSSLGSPVTGGF